MPVHLDGARFSNAIAATGATPAEMTWKAGVDVVSFGGSKNGLMGVEAVILFDPDKAWEFELRRKRAGHLMAKHRYLSAQMEAYLTNDLWRELAEAANLRGAELAAGMASVPNARFIHPQQANMMFCAWDRSGHDRAAAAGVPLGSYRVDCPDGRDQLAARLVTNWSTTTSDVERFIDLIS
jgi:threonine aldolase